MQVSWDQQQFDIIYSALNHLSDAKFFWLDLIASVVLVVTAGFSFMAARAAKKSSRYSEYSQRPTAYFLLYRSMMYVKNTSNFLVKFYFRMSLDGKILANGYWQDPLYIYPGAGFMQFPHAFNPDQLISGQIKIEYRVVPSHIQDSELHKEIQVIDWTYNVDTKKWVGPNGIQEEGILRFFSNTGRC